MLRHFSTRSLAVVTADLPCYEKVLLGARYTKMQYMGALVVVAGLIAVLAPSFQGGASSQQGPYHSQLVWAAVLVVSCIPMCLSSVYKEKALGETEIDVSQCLI